MNNKFKMLLKTTAAVATLMAGSQTWAATAYAPGSTECGNARFDTVTLSGAGHFGAFSAPTSGVDTVFITISGTGAAINAGTAMPSFPSTVKHIWFLGGDGTLSTVLTSAAKDYAFAIPPANSIIHFNLTTAPAAASYWFAGALPTSCTVAIEPGSADPKIWTSLGATLNFSKLLLGAPVLLVAANTTINAAVARHKDITEANAASAAQITTAAAVTLKKAVTGVSFAGANALTFEADSTIVDPAAAVAGYTISAGKKLTMLRNAVIGAQGVLAVTVGAKAKLEIIDK